MDAIRIEPADRPVSRSTGVAWPPSATVLDWTYFAVFVVIVALALGWTDVMTQPSSPKAPEPIAGDAPVAQVRSVSYAIPFNPGERVGTNVHGLNQEQLMTFHLRCARDTSRERMGFDQAVACGEAADVLLGRTFDGDLNRMIDWWQGNGQAGD